MSRNNINFYGQMGRVGIHIRLKWRINVATVLSMLALPRAPGITS